MAMTVKHLRAPATGVLVLILAVATLAALPEEAGNPVQIPRTLQETIAQIETGEAEEQARATAQEEGLVPMASPCLMRRPRMAPRVDANWRRAFAAATLATDPATRETVLTGLSRGATDDVMRWRIDIARAELALRMDDSEMARGWLAQAAQREVPDNCRADELFYLAAATSSVSERATHFAHAVALDPGFWAAQEELAVLSMTGTGDDAQSCETDAVRTLDTVVQLAALARRDTQFHRLHRALEALPVNGRTALMRGMILRQTGETDAAREAYRSGLATLGASACEEVLRAALEGMLSMREERQ